MRSLLDLRSIVQVFVAARLSESSPGRRPRSSRPSCARIRRFAWFSQLFLRFRGGKAQDIARVDEPAEFTIPRTTRPAILRGPLCVEENYPLPFPRRAAWLVRSLMSTPSPTPSRCEAPFRPGWTERDREAPRPDALLWGAHSRTPLSRSKLDRDHESSGQENNRPLVDVHPQVHQGYSHSADHSLPPCRT